MKTINNSRGMTLVELIIVLSLISLVLAGAFSIFMFGNRTFAGGTNQRDLQSDVRMSMAMITHDVRYATKLEVTTGAVNLALLMTKSDNIYPNVEPFQTWIFYDTSSSAIVRLQQNSMEMIPLETDSPQPLVFNIGSPPSTLKYKVDGINTLGGRQFSVESEILMLNIAGGSTTAAIGVANGTVIVYRTPADKLSELKAPDIFVDTLIDFSNTEVTLKFDRPVYYSAADPFEVIAAGSGVNELKAAHVTVIQDDTTTLTIYFDDTIKKPSSFVEGDTIKLYLTYTVDGENYIAVYSVMLTTETDNKKVFKWATI